MIAGASTHARSIECKYDNVLVEYECAFHVCMCCIQVCAYKSIILQYLLPSSSASTFMTHECITYNIDVLYMNIEIVCVCVVDVILYTDVNHMIQYM